MQELDNKNVEGIERKIYKIKIDEIVIQSQKAWFNHEVHDTTKEKSWKDGRSGHGKELVKKARQQDWG